MVYRRTIPWVQDTGAEDVWGRWGVANRDVVVLDSLNHPAAVYNLTEHNLAIPADYDSLKALLLRIAG